MRLAVLLLFTTALQAQTPAQKTPVVLPNGHLRVSSGTMGGLLLYHPNPILSDECRGVVSCSAIVHVVIGKTGEVEEVTPISGPAPLLANFMKTVKTWRYKPYLLDGEPHVVETVITMNFLICCSSAAPPATPPSN